MLISNGLTLACTFAFWAVVNRAAEDRQAARAAAVLSAVNLVGGIAQVNLQAMFQRLLPAHRDPARFALRGYAWTAGLALALGVVGLAVCRQVPDLRFVTASPALVGVALVGAVVTAVFAIEDGVLGALGRYAWIPASNASFSVARLALVAVWHDNPTEVLLAWFAPMVLCTAAVNVAVFRRWLPAHRPVAAGPDVPAGYVGAEAVSWILATGCQWVLPVLVLVRSGEQSSQAFYLAMTTAVALGAVVVSITGGLTVSASRHPEHAAALARRASLAALGATVVGASVLALAAPVAMDLFGVTDRSLGVDLLRIMAAASVVRVAVSLAVARARLRLDGRTLVGLQVVHVTVALGTFALFDSSMAAAWAWLAAQVATAAVALVLTRRGD